MKRVIALILSMLLIFAFCGCGAGEKASDNKVEDVKPVAEQKGTGKKAIGDDVPPVDGFEASTTIEDVVERFKKSNPDKRSGGVFLQDYQWKGLTGLLAFKFQEQGGTLFSERGDYTVSVGTNKGNTEQEVNDVFDKSVEAYKTCVEYFGMSVEMEKTDDPAYKELNAVKDTGDGYIRATVIYTAQDGVVKSMFQLTRFIYR